MASNHGVTIWLDAPLEVIERAHCRRDPPAAGARSASDSASCTTSAATPTRAPTTASRPWIRTPAAIVASILALPLFRP